MKNTIKLSKESAVVVERHADSVSISIERFGRTTAAFSLGQESFGALMFALEVAGEEAFGEKPVALAA